MLFIANLHQRILSHGTVKSHLGSGQILANQQRIGESKYQLLTPQLEHVLKGVPKGVEKVSPGRNRCQRSITPSIQRPKAYQLKALLSGQIKVPMT
jgi:hypothetical protein